jgi:hypothetical protein
MFILDLDKTIFSFRVSDPGSYIKRGLKKIKPTFFLRFQITARSKIICIQTFIFEKKNFANVKKNAYGILQLFEKRTPGPVLSIFILHYFSGVKIPGICESLEESVTIFELTRVWCALFGQL